MNAFYTGTSFYAGQRAMIPLVTQIEAYAHAVQNEAEFRKNWRDNKPMKSDEIDEDCALVIDRLNKHGISERSFTIAKACLKGKDMTLQTVSARLNRSTKTVRDMLSKLLSGRFVSVSGYFGRERIWHWEG